ncbi:hypothetical protein Pan258_03040 [Symmachiella dynata]|nr:hypothetical protein Pan258_03040 [Symmachiella dynata]
MLRSVHRFSSFQVGPPHGQWFRQRYLRLGRLVRNGGNQYLAKCFRSMPEVVQLRIEPCGDRFIRCRFDGATPPPPNRDCSKIGIVS